MSRPKPWRCMPRGQSTVNSVPLNKTNAHQLPYPLKVANPFNPRASKKYSPRSILALLVDDETDAGLVEVVSQKAQCGLYLRGSAIKIVWP